jgi:VWFA-related protein
MFFRLLPLAAAAIALLQSQPSFRSGIDLIRLDVSVVDKAGFPVKTLKAEDFVVRVDGSPRAVSFARFYGPDEERPAIAGPASPAAFATNVNRESGRLVVFVVDLASIKPGSEKLILETAGKLVTSLAPTDLAGLLPIPGKGVEATRDRARITAAIAGLRGLPAARNYRVLDGECRVGDTNCAREAAEEAKQIAFDSQQRLLSVVTTLTALNTRLQQIDSPKSIVLISGGLAFPRSEMSRLLDLERSVAVSGTSMYVIQVEQPEADASSGVRPGAGALPRSDLRDGLESIAGATNGEFFAGVGKAVGVFERVQSGILNSYQIGVESIPRDADGKSHKIDVQVRAGGLTVKTRKELVVTRNAGAARTPTEVLGLPVERNEAPMAASAYVLRGEEPSTLMVLTLVELLTGAAARPLPSYAVTIEDDGGVKFGNAADLQRTAENAGRAIIATHLSPGSYRLRAAVVDSSGRAGSIDLPLRVGLRQASPFQVSDLLLGTVTDKFAPATHVAPSTNLAATIELYAADAAQLADARVDFELRKDGDAEVIARTAASVAQTELDRRRVAEGQIPLQGLGPGSYTISAVIQHGTTAVGKVSRTIVIIAP